MDTKRLHTKHWLTGIRGGLGAAVTLAIVVACASGEPSGPLPSGKALDPEVQALVTADFGFDRERRHHHCPTPEAISVTINRVRVLDAAGVWHVTSTATQTIQLFPVRDLAGPLGLASLAAGSYQGVLLDVVDGVVSLGGNAQSLSSPAHRLFVNGDFTVVAGRVPVFVPDVDPRKAVHCVRDVDCERKQGHDHGHDDDGDHDGHHDHDHGDRDGHDGHGSHDRGHDGDHDDGDHDDRDHETATMATATTAGTTTATAIIGMVTACAR